MENDAEEEMLNKERLESNVLGLVQRKSERVRGSRTRNGCQ